jgi:hypothetical protein
MARLVVRCPRCGHVNPAEQNICERCPTSLMGQPFYSEPQEENPLARLQEPVAGPPAVQTPGVCDTVAIDDEDQLVLIHLSTGARLRVTGDALLGRAGTVALDFFDPLLTVSRRHASLRRTGPGRWTMTDERSRHGTYVNGERLLPGVPRVLRAGDIVKLADHSFVVSLT